MRKQITQNPPIVSSASDLALMADLQRLNAVLIGQNMAYADRKSLLMDRATRKLAA